MITISKIPIGKYYCYYLLDLNAVSKDCFKDYKYVIIYDKLESSYKIHLCECIDLFVNNKKDYIDNNLYELLLKISLVNSYIHHPVNVPNILRPMMNKNRPVNKCLNSGIPNTLNGAFCCLIIGGIEFF